MAKKTTQVEVVALFAKYGLKVTAVYDNSFTPLESKCLTCKNTVFPRLDKVKSRGYRCAHCSGRANPAKKAEEVVKKMGHTPLAPYPGAREPWKMKCGGCGQTITPKYNSIQQGRWGCGYCGHLRAGAQKRELGSKRAIKMMRDAFCEPLAPYPGNNAPWKSRCMKCDSLIQPRLAGIQSGQGGCRKCGIISGAKTRMHTEEQATKIALKKKLVPVEPYKGNTKRWKCKCTRCGKISSPFFSAIRDGKYGCLWCAKKIVDPAEARKKMENAGLHPLIAYPGSDIGWLCKCKKCNREVTPAYGSIRAGQGGCKWCKAANPRIDSSIAVQALLEKDIQPLEPFKTSHSKWKSRCLRCEREIYPSYHDIKQGSGGCKYCAPNFVNEKRINDVMKKANFEPQEKYPGSKVPWKVRHNKCGRVFKVVYANVRKTGSCRYCAGAAVIPKEAVEIMKQMGMKPVVPYPGAKKPWKCKCNVCKRIIYPSFSSVSNRESGCVYCTGHKVDGKDAKKIMLLNNLKPLEAFPGAVKKWKCKCLLCNRIITPRYTSIQGGQGGCRFCAKWGIDYAGKGFIYLMTNKQLSAHKIGISGNVQTKQGDRVKKHQESGWELYKKLDFETADDAFIIEQSTLVWLRKEKKLQAFLSEFEMPQGGYTETIDASEIDLPTIWAKVEELSKVKR